MLLVYRPGWGGMLSDAGTVPPTRALPRFPPTLRSAPGGPRLPEEEVWNVLIQVSEGLNHLHSIRVLHRDIKARACQRAKPPKPQKHHCCLGKPIPHPLSPPSPQASNIFLDPAGTVVIGDLGLGRALGCATTFAHTRGIGTPLYYSPEVCEEAPYNSKSDIWAFGCLLYELLAGEPPFTAANQARAWLRVYARHSSSQDREPSRHAPPSPPVCNTLVPCQQRLCQRGAGGARPEDYPRRPEGASPGHFRGADASRHEDARQAAGPVRI